MNKKEYVALGKSFFKHGKDILDASNWAKITTQLAENRKISNKDKKVNLIFLGIAIELFLKAAFIKKGYLIFKTNIPIKINSFEQSWNQERTVDVKDLINNLELIFKRGTSQDTIKKFKHNLRIITDFRNAEAHSIGMDFNKNADEYLRVMNIIINIASKGR